MNKVDKKQNSEAQNNSDRRGFIKTTGVVAGSAIAAQQWGKPIVESVILPAHAQMSDPATVVDILLDSAPEFTTLVQLVSDAGLVPTLQGPGPFTVFAPTNAAFTAISATLATLTPTQVETVLLFHVLSGVQPASALPATTGATPNITAGPIAAGNGQAFVIDQVLIPAGL